MAIRWELDITLSRSLGAPKLNAPLTKEEYNFLERKRMSGLQDLTEQALSHLIDLALDLKDYKWAESLQKRRVKRCSDS